MYYSSKLTFKLSVPTFTQVEKLLQGHITVILVNSKFWKHHLQLFWPQNDTISWKCFLVSKPDKMLISHSSGPGKNFARANLWLVPSRLHAEERRAMTGSEGRKRERKTSSLSISHHRPHSPHLSLINI